MKFTVAPVSGGMCLSQTQLDSTVQRGTAFEYHALTLLTKYIHSNPHYEPSPLSNSIRPPPTPINIPVPDEFLGQGEALHSFLYHTSKG